MTFLSQLKTSCGKNVVNLKKVIARREKTEAVPEIPRLPWQTRNRLRNPVFLDEIATPDFGRDRNDDETLGKPMMNKHTI